MHNPTSSLVTTKIGHLGFLKRGNCCMCAYLCSHTSNLKKPEILCSPEMIILVELTMELVLKTPFRSLAQVIWNELVTNLLGVQVFLLIGWKVLILINSVSPTFSLLLNQWWMANKLQNMILTEVAGVWPWARIVTQCGLLKSREVCARGWLPYFSYFAVW
jgi:hypothetical protein